VGCISEVMEIVVNSKFAGAISSAYMQSIVYNCVVEHSLVKSIVA
jgi:hypothetical protein